MRRALTCRLALAVCVALSCSPARADLGLVADRPQASLVTWWPSVTGSLGARLGAVGAGIDYSDESRTSVGATLALRTFGAVCLDLDYTPIETDAAVASHAAFSFRNLTFGVTGTGHLTYRMPILGLGLRYLVLSGRRGNLGLIGAVKAAEPDVHLALGGVSASFHMVLPVPLAGVSGELALTDHLRAFASYKMLHLDVAAVNVKVDNWETGLAWSHPVARSHEARAALGYRRLDFDLASGSAGDLRLSTRRGGPFAELALAF